MSVPKGVDPVFPGGQYLIPATHEGCIGQSLFRVRRKAQYFGRLHVFGKEHEPAPVPSPEGWVGLVEDRGCGVGLSFVQRFFHLREQIEVFPDLLQVLIAIHSLDHGEGDRELPKRGMHSDELVFREGKKVEAQPAQ